MYCVIADPAVKMGAKLLLHLLLSHVISLQCPPLPSTTGQAPHKTEIRQIQQHDVDSIHAKEEKNNNCICSSFIIYLFFNWKMYASYVSKWRSKYCLWLKGTWVQCYFRKWWETTTQYQKHNRITKRNRNKFSQLVKNVRGVITNMQQ